MFLRIVHLRIDRVWMPGKGEKHLRLHGLHHDLHAQMLISWIGDLAAEWLASYKWTVHFRHEPFAKLARVREGDPHPAHGRDDFDFFFDLIFHYTQPLSCMLDQVIVEAQLFSCT